MVVEIKRLGSEREKPNMTPDILYYPNFFLTPYFDKLKSEIEWKHEDVTLYSKTYPLPRLTAWYGERGYTYSGISASIRPWTDALLEIKNKIENVSKYSFDGVLLNLYRNGRDSVSWHSDDEPSLRQDEIASVSFGETRIFKMKSKTTNDKFEIPLNNGDLLIMKGDTQKKWLHSIPKTGKITGERINLTFRKTL